MSIDIEITPIWTTDRPRKGGMPASYVRSRVDALLASPECHYVDLGTVMVIATGIDAGTNVAAALERGFIERATDFLEGGS